MRYNGLERLALFRRSLLSRRVNQDQCVRDNCIYGGTSVRQESTLSVAIFARTFPVDGPLLMLIYTVGYMSPSRPTGGLGGSPDDAACTYIAPPYLTENYLGFISSLTTPLNRRNLIWIIHDSAENTSSRVYAVFFKCSPSPRKRIHNYCEVAFFILIVRFSYNSTFLKRFRITVLFFEKQFFISSLCMIV